MPYRPKITEILDHGTYEFMGEDKLNGTNHRLYKATGMIYHEDIENLILSGYRLGAIDGQLRIARPSQIRSYKTE